MNKLILISFAFIGMLTSLNVSAQQCEITNGTNIGFVVHLETDATCGNSNGSSSVYVPANTTIFHNFPQVLTVVRVINPGNGNFTILALCTGTTMLTDLSLSVPLFVAGTISNYNIRAGYNQANGDSGVIITP